MRNGILALGLWTMAMPSFAQSGAAAQGKIILPDNFIEITIGAGEDAPSTTSRKNSKQDAEIGRLKGRVRSLEEAVRQLQEEIYWLRYAQNRAQPTTVVIPVSEEKKPSSWFCSVISNFDRTFTGKGTTQVEARAQAMAACQQKDGGIHCDENKARCEKAE